MQLLRPFYTLSCQNCFIILLLVAPIIACSGVHNSRPRALLGRSIDNYHSLLRWAKYDAASKYRSSDEQMSFMAAYLAEEEDLHVERIEVRAIQWVTESTIPTAHVIAIAYAYLLPSTTLEKIMMQQEWQFLNDHWVLIKSDRELVPTSFNNN